MIDERIDRTKLESVSLEQAEIDDIQYWMSRTPTERIEGIEYLRRWLYGDAQVNARLQRVLELVELESD